MRCNNHKLLIICSHKAEADPIINFFSLVYKRLQGISVYQNDDIVVIIIGEGDKHIEYCLNRVFIAYNIQYVINYGVCGSDILKVKVGSIFIINKIYCYRTDQLYYPVRLFDFDLTGAAIMTVDAPVYETFDCKYPDIHLVDMESSHVFRNLNNRICPSKVFIFKIVSDHLNEMEYTKESLFPILTPSLDRVTNIVINLNKSDNSYHLINDNVNNTVNQLFSRFKFTFSQQSELKRVILYKSHNDPTFTETILSCLPATCHTKHETAKLYHKIRNEALAESI
tara:strand:- start:16401 stop:17246 length:846 start_codon:yes stop_codon:yes gene_type:complete